ncbi:MAG: hypothetical protein IH944_00035 [Armatimonadetes bacterium]|nr:hypothetical protein [Armatimonadota bacterium]
MLQAIALILALSPASPANWSVNEHGTVLWDGEPYMPIGLRIAGDPESVRAALDAGILDLIVELPVDGSGWESTLEVLHESDARFMIAISSLAPSSRGIAVEPHGYRIEKLQGIVHVVASIPGAISAIAVIADNRTSAIRFAGRIETPGGRIDREFDTQVLVPHVLLLYPELTNSGIPDFWEGFDEHRDQLLLTLRRNELGSGFRGILDPLGQVSVFPAPDLSAVPTSPLFHLELETFLARKYGSPVTCMRAWSIGSNDIETFEQLSRLIPLWSDTRGVELLYDPVFDKVFASNRINSLAWKDIREVVRSTALRRYERLLQSINRELNCPVFQTWSGWSGPYDSDRIGLTGVGVRIRGDSLYHVIDQLSKAAGSALVRQQVTAIFATDVELTTQGRFTLSAALLEMKSMGVRGAFFRAKSKEQVAVISRIARKLRADVSDAEWSPTPLFYPESAMNPARPGRIFGGWWWYPAPAAGERLDYGSQLLGYRYAGSTDSYSVIWAREDGMRVKLLFSNTENIELTALDGRNLRIRKRRDSIELNMPSIPVIIRNTFEIPIPQVSYEETVLQLTALFSNFENRVDPTGSRQYDFVRLIEAFKRNPSGAYPGLTHLLHEAIPKAAPYLWIEGEHCRDYNFSEPRLIPGCSGDGGLVLDTRLSGTNSSYYARFPLRTRTEGEHEFWIAARIPESVRDKVTVTIGTETLRLDADPVSFYGLGFAWYKLGSANMPRGTIDVVLHLDAPPSADLELDVIVASPVRFQPDGPWPPVGFLLASPPPKG